MARFASFWFDPRFETIKSRVRCVPGIKVVRGETQVIGPRHASHFPIVSVLRYNNGDLRIHDRRSSDGCRTLQSVDGILKPTTFESRNPAGRSRWFAK